MKTAAPRTPAPPAAPQRVRITRPGDALERDADRMADAALAAGPVAATATVGPDTVMRQAATGPEFEEDDDFDVAPAARPGGPAPAPHGFLDAVRSSSGGHGLAEPQQARFEQGFGRPLDHVRIHDDTAAARLADSVNARAFTHGTHVFFAHGEHRPGPEGDRLLAHELAHTLQRPGPGTVARQPKFDPPKQRDPAKMTKQEKIAWKKWITELARAETADRKKQFKRPDAAKKATWITALDAAIGSAAGIADQRQQEVRLGVLRAERRLFNDDFYAWLITTGRIDLAGGPTAFTRLGNPAVTFTANELEVWESHLSVMAGGAEAYSNWLTENYIYGRLDIDPAGLETGDPSAGKGGKGGKGGGTGTGVKAGKGAGAGAGTGGTGSGAQGAPGGTGTADTPDISAVTQQQRALDELNIALGDVMSDIIGDDDPADLAEKLKTLTDEERKDFYEFARKLAQTSQQDPSKAPKGTTDLLELFKKLDPASREALKVNREMAEAQPGKEDEALPAKVLLNVRKEAIQTAAAAKDARQINSSLEAIRAVTRDPEAKKKLSGVSLDDVFLQELAMLRGLLAGGGRESPLVASAGQILIHEINEIHTYLQQRLAKMAARLVIAEAAAAVTEGLALLEVVEILNEIREIKNLIDKLRQAYRIYERIRDAVELVRGLRQKIPEFIGWYHDAEKLAAKIQTELAKLESGEDVDEALQKLEDDLLERFETMLEDKLGALLELLYIPADTSYEQLRDLVFGIPHGIDALGDMWDYYRNVDRSRPGYTEILAIKAFKAGRLLYPFVGLTAALTAKAIRAVFADRSNLAQLEKLMPGASDKPETLRERMLALFRRMSPKRYTLDPTAALEQVGKGKAALAKALEGLEPTSAGTQYWAPAWFRTSVRRKIKVVNQQFKGQTIKATRKVKGGGKQADQIPLPPFRVKVKRRGGKLQAVVKLNPDDTITKTELSNAAFRDEGEAFAGTDTDRQESIRKWLREAGYEFGNYPAGHEYIRLPRGDRETPKRSYLRFEGGRIKAGIDKDAWQPFIGRLIHDSRDLPEGYYAVHLKTVDTVSRKRGLARTHQELGLDKHHKLQKGAGKAPPLELAKANVKIQDDDYDIDDTLNRMFAPNKPGEPEYDTTGLTRANWEQHLKTKVRKRPMKISGRLGYVVRARAYGSKDLHIPELRKGDDRGHLVAMRFDGLDDYPNVIPMLSKENRFPGKWYGLETDMAKTYVGDHVQHGHYLRFDLTVTYPTTAKKTRRPQRLDAYYEEMDAADKPVGKRVHLPLENG